MVIANGQLSFVKLSKLAKELDSLALAVTWQQSSPGLAFRRTGKNSLNMLHMRRLYSLGNFYPLLRQW